MFEGVLHPGSSVLKLEQTVSILGGEEGYTAKYGLNPGEFPRTQLTVNFQYITFRNDIMTNA